MPPIHEPNNNLADPTPERGHPPEREIQMFARSGRTSHSPFRKNRKINPARNYRPRLEVLETRVVPTTLIWNGASPTNDNWSDPANWGGAGVPASGNDLVFPQGASQVSAVNNETGLNLNSITFT